MLHVPEDALPEVKRTAVQKTHILDFYFCRRVKKAVTFFLQNAMIVNWVWYWYEFQMRRSIHAHGTMKPYLQIF